jgi:hypothetical protein
VVGTEVSGGLSGGGECFGAEPMVLLLSRRAGGSEGDGSILSVDLTTYIRYHVVVSLHFLRIY